MMSDAIEAALVAFCCGKEPGGKCRKSEFDDVCGGGYWGDAVPHAIAAWCAWHAARLDAIIEYNRDSADPEDTYRAEELRDWLRQQERSLSTMEGERK
jgi:hypothetical protein